MDYSQYVAHLTRYPSFSRGESDLPQFTYANANDMNLQGLREQYRLDQIAGDGDHLSRALRIMHWVHGELSHHGDQVAIEPREAMSIIETCRRTRCAVWCFDKAIVLTEALLSVGIQSRRLTCLPYAFDHDCHVVTMAFLPELMKWVVLDPSFDTFFHDEHGSPLSPLEIRELYRENRRPVFKHIEANKAWALVMNGVECATYDEWYTAYMAKNSFRFGCPLASEYGQAGREEAYVFLDPVGYAERNAYDTIQATAYRTDNAEYFFS